MKFKSITFFWFILCMVVFSGFAFADDHGDRCDSTATYMSLNTSQSGNIETAGDVDLFRVNVPSSGLLTVYTTGSTDTYGGLGDSNCWGIEWDDDDGDGYNFKISQFVTAGTYYVAVWHYSQYSTGAYTLHVQFGGTTDDHGNTCTTATPITLSGGIGSQSGTLTAGDYDYFSVDVPSSGTLTAYTTGSTDTYGYLKNSGCQDIHGAEDDDAGDGTNFHIRKSVTAGTYYVAVRHYRSSGTGAYTLNVSFRTPNDIFTWPVDPDNYTDGQYTGTDSSQTIMFWLHESITANTVWRDEQPFQRYSLVSGGTKKGYHLGADYNLGGGDADLNEDVYPVAPGKVSLMLDNVCGFGNIIFVEHDTSFGIYTSMYAHVKDGFRHLSQGADVTPANPIAQVGKGVWTTTSSCDSSGLYDAHLHFEIRRGTDTTPGHAYTKDSKCGDSSDSDSNNCPQNQVDPNVFIRTHN
jgi:murein DD-endopeptidase MepM/ murein hydrolase activator NlpD